MRLAFDQIYRDLKREIENGIYSYGELLPSQSTLVERYQCAHNTARKAIAKLAKMGYCIPIHGKGVRVTFKPRRENLAFTLNNIGPFIESAERDGIQATTEIKAFETIVADEKLSSITGFPVGTELVHNDRIRILDGKAHIHDISYYRASAVPGLTREQAEKTVYGYLLNELGLRLAMRKRTITIEPASDVEHQWLDLDGSNLLAKVACQTFTGDGSLFEYGESHIHPDWFYYTDVIVND